MRFGRPIAKVNQAAAMAAKGLEFFFFEPKDFLFAGRAFNFHTLIMGMRFRKYNGLIKKEYPGLFVRGGFCRWMAP